MIFRLTVNDTMNDNEFSIRTYNMINLKNYLDLLDNFFDICVKENNIKVDMDLIKECEKE